MKEKKESAGIQEFFIYYIFNNIISLTSPYIISALSMIYFYSIIFYNYSH